ncbi:coiled-coil domain-containing protein [Lysinibacillus capsici]|uniref:coiled-coil domain-containing protein n=1 Tax=Lysinibacillus capsici TaxID=2115968 RepID=UPI0036D0D167
MKRYEGSPAVVIERRKGTPDSPFSNMNESLVVTGDGKVLLSEIPNELNRVIVTSEGNTTWYEVTEGRVPENGFKVDYINKLVTFNTVHVGKQLNFKYLGEGNHFYSPHSIYTKLEDKTVVETLGDIIEGGKNALGVLATLDKKINEVTQVANDAHAATDAANQITKTATEKIKVVEHLLDELNVLQGELEQMQLTLITAAMAAQTAATNANEATVNANTAITNAEAATTNAIVAAQAANDKISEASQLVTALETLKSMLEQMQSSLSQASIDAHLATVEANNAAINANAAKEDLSITVNTKIDEADVSITKANNAANIALEASESIAGWGTAEVWSATKTYVKNNIVTYYGSTWQAINNNINSSPSPTNVSWILLAQRGVDGTGSVSSINGIPPDETGNITIAIGEGNVKSVNGKTGVVEIESQDIKTKFEKTSGFLKQEEYQYLRASQSVIDTFILEAIAEGHLYYEIINGRNNTNQVICGLVTSSNEMHFKDGSSYIDNISQNTGHYLIWTIPNVVITNKNVAFMYHVPYESRLFTYKTTFSKGSLLDIAKFNIDGKLDKIDIELAKTGKVKSVNNILPDENGNVQVDSSYVITSPKLPEAIDYRDGFTFFQPSKTLDTPIGVDYQQAWYNYLTTEFPHIISDNVGIWALSHSIKVFTFYRFTNGKGTTPHEKTRLQEIHMVSPTDGTVYKFERLCVANTWSIKMTYDFKKPSIKSINSVLPDENGNVNIEMRDGGNSFFKSYILPTTTVGQKVWSLPASSYDANIDSIAVFYNGDLMNINEYTLTGDAVNGYQINIENPIEEIEDNNVTVIVLRNARSDEPNEMSGLLLTDDSVAMNKLGQDVKDAIANAGSKVDIIDDLTSNRTDTVVSARVSKMIYDEIGYVDDRIDNHSSEKASSGSTGHVKPDDITTKTDATGKISVITSNDFTGGVDKVASAEIIKNLKGQFDNHIGDNNRHLTTNQKNQLHAMNATPLVDGRWLINDELDIITLNPTQLREACAGYIGYGKASFFCSLSKGGVSSTYGTYGILTVNIPWSDNSGGFMFVTLETATATLKRYESSPTAWTAWKVTQTTNVDINDLFQSVSSGKALVANAITGKGVSTSTTAEFATMANNINAIQTGRKAVNGTMSVALNAGETRDFTVSGLGFYPKNIMHQMNGERIMNGFKWGTLHIADPVLWIRSITYGQGYFTITASNQTSNYFSNTAMSYFASE